MSPIVVRARFGPLPVLFELFSLTAHPVKIGESDWIGRSRLDGGQDAKHGEKEQRALPPTEHKSRAFQDAPPVLSTGNPVPIENL